MIVFASDLDNTMIYSYKKIKHPAICVEKKEEKELSYMTSKAHFLLQKIAKEILFVPITTRSVEQYERIFMLEDKKASYALASNGGTLLIDGKKDTAWLNETKKLMEDTLPELEKAIYFLKKDKNVSFEIRLIDDIFVYTKTKDVQNSLSLLSEKLDLNKVFVDSNGEKLYVFPNRINKGSALKRFRNYLKSKFIIAAGDSAFDIPMLKEADSAIIPNEKFLYEALKEHKKLYIAKNQGEQFAEEILEIVAENIINKGEMNE